MNKLKIICPFCNASYTAKMQHDLIRASEATSPSGYGASATVEIIIRCSNCRKIVYKKYEDIE